MIKDNMFYTEPTIVDYREMDIRAIIREFLLTKGTWTGSIWQAAPPKPTNRTVHPKDLVASGLFVYGLKDNATNKRAIEYYCEKWGHIHQIIDDRGVIRIPADLWEECDKENKEFTKRNQIRRADV